MSVSFKNLVIPDGVFDIDTAIRTVTVPVGGFSAGTLLGKVTSSGKYILSNAVKYTTTGSAQTVTTAIGEVVHFAVASGSTGTGTVGNYYQALTVQAALDLDAVAFATDTTNWKNLGAIVGSETAVAVLKDDIANVGVSPVDVKALVYVAGTFNDLGITYGNGQDITKTYDSLDLKNIRIVSGRA